MARQSLLLLFAWLVAGALFLSSATWPPVSRTQEARVLETAREMAGKPVADWAIPRLNGAVRLRKPPLAYWMSAASFRLFGVGDVQGRLPMTTLAWLTVGVSFLIARRLFDPLVATFAAAVLAGSWLFFKTAMLAETDGPTTAFLVLGVYAFLRASDADRDGSRDGKHDGVWQHLLAVCYSGAILSKGPPAVYLLLLTIALCAVRGRWRPLMRLVTSGAVVTLVLLAVPWFAYVARHSTEEGQLGRDFLNSAEGGDHHAPPWYYVQLLLQATLPWTAVWAATLAAAAATLLRAWRTSRERAEADPAVDSDAPRPRRPAALFALEPGLVTIALWGLCVIVPLCFWGNKQLQYLLPAMPPTAMLIGWALAGVARDRRASMTSVATIATSGLLVLLNAAAVVGLLAVRSRTGQSFDAADAALATVLFGVAVWAALRWRSGRTAGIAATVLTGAGVLFVALAWMPRATGGLSRQAALQVTREYPAGRFVFRSSELPVMSWAMRHAVPLLGEPAIEAAAADPHTVVLEQQQDDEHEPTPPAGFVRGGTIKQRENVLHVFVPAGPTTRPE